MKRAVIFRFYKEPSICKNRLELLKKFNPKICIFGIFSGSIKSYEKKFRYLETHFEDVFLIKGKHHYWKWINGDLTLREWYKKVGRKTDFDMFHIIDWDLLMFDSLDNIYRRIPKNCVGLTGLIPMKPVEKEWDWVSEGIGKKEWEKLIGYVKKRHGYISEPYGSLGPGACLPRKFLEKYSQTKVPELCHEEVRIPLFSQLLGFKLYDTGFYKKWFSEEERRYFNCRGREIKLAVIKKELAKKQGRRVFHPYYKTIRMKKLKIT